MRAPPGVSEDSSRALRGVSCGGNRIGEPVNGDDFKPLNRRFRRVGARNDGFAETEFGGFLKAFLTARGRAYFAGKAGFAEDNESCGHGAVTDGAGNRKHHGEVACGFGDFDAAHGVDKHH